MVTDNYINENKTETFKKGDKVIMHSCHESTLQEYKDKIWICLTSTFLDKTKQEVVFLEDFSGYFIAKYLKICNSTGMSFYTHEFNNKLPNLMTGIDVGGSYSDLILQQDFDKNSFSEKIED